MYRLPSRSISNTLNSTRKFCGLPLLSSCKICNFGSPVCGNDHLEIMMKIRQHTIISRLHLTPEIRLNLITPECELWRANYCKSPFVDPYWAFYWPGGQALSRFVLDNPQFVVNKTVVDVGCGSGACGIAAALSGASKVIANDIDAVACVATALNSELNHVNLGIVHSNIIGEDSSWNCMLIGDMFYDEEFSCDLYQWLSFINSKGTTVLIGDVGRMSKLKINFHRLRLLKTYQLPENIQFENDGLSVAQVWSF